MIYIILHTIEHELINVSTVLFDVLFLGFLLDKKVGVNQPKRIENAKILIANTPMDADKVKVRDLALLIH